MPDKSAYIQRLDVIENRVYQEYLKPLGFRKHGRAINRIVDGDMVQIVYFEGGNTIRQENDSFRVHFSIRVPEAVERTFTPKPLKKGGYPEWDANFRMYEMCKLEQLKSIPTYYRYPLFEGCEEQYVERIITVLKEKILPVFEMMDTREKFLQNRSRYAYMAWLEHLQLLDRAMILGRMGCMKEAQENLQWYYEESTEEDWKRVGAGKMTAKNSEIRKQYVEDLAKSLGIELRKL